MQQFVVSSWRTAGLSAMLLIPVAHATEPPAQDDLATQLKVLKEQLASQRQLLEQLSRQVQAQRAVAVTDGVAATSAEQLDAQRGAGNVEPQEAADAHVDPDASDLPVVPVARALQDLPTRQASAAVPPRRAVGRPPTPRRPPAGGGAAVRAARCADAARQARARAIVAVQLFVEQPRCAGRLHRHPRPAHRPGRRTRSQAQHGHCGARRAVRTEQPARG